MITLPDTKHEVVKLQLQRLEWAGTAGIHCPECGGVRPKDGPRVETLDKTGAVVSATVAPAIVLNEPNPHEGHGIDCKLALSIAIISGPDRVVVYCKDRDGVPRGYEEGK